MIIEQTINSDTKEILTLQKLSYRDETKLYDYHHSSKTQTLKDMQNDFGKQVLLRTTVDGRMWVA